MSKKRRRIKVKGHYLTVERNSSGRFVKVNRWKRSYDHDSIANRLAKKLGTKHRIEGVDILSRRRAIEVAVSKNDIHQSIGQLKRSRASKRYMAVPRRMVPYAKRQLKGTGIGVMTTSGKVRKRPRRKRPIV